MKRLYTILMLAALTVISLPAAAQGARTMISNGDKALGSYNFELARNEYLRALERTQDTTERMVLMEKITWCENGLSMLQYACRPQVISSITVPRNRFFLYYSHFPDKSWRKGPDGEVFLYTDDMDKVIIPSRGTPGTYDLNFATRISGDKWSPLSDMGDGINSAEDEIYPVLSEDGKKVYFSSKGLCGMGGYDIFVSEWDEDKGQWGAAENIGFPYSSPYDDMLFCNTPDGNFSLFASNRACDADSMVIYLLKYDPKPVKTAVESVEEARRLAALRPRPNISFDIDENLFSHSMYGDDAFAKYFALVGRYSAVKDSLKTLQSSLAAARVLYGDSDEDDRKALEGAITQAEGEIFALQGRLGDISSELQAVEMDFLLRGTEINPEEIEQAVLEESAERAGNSPGQEQYAFIQRTMGQMPEFDFAKPEVEVDMSFKVLEESVLVEDYSLPEGLVYQIQLAATSNKLSPDRLKGLSPAFSKKTGGKYIYYVGMFDTWADANKALAVVKKKGFSSAAVVAFNNGTSIGVKNARALEAKQRDNQKFRVVFKGYPSGVPAEVLEAVRKVSQADMARASEGGGVIYFIAPLDRATADKIRAAAIDAGGESITVEPIKQ